MGKHRPVIVWLLVVAGLATGVYLGWRYFWFFRDPPRTPPSELGMVSPADGTVVYVETVAPQQDVIVIKQGLAAKIRDIVREDVDAPKIVIGIFMSPFDVHYNRAPLTATVDMVRRHPGFGENAHMGPMHWRTLLNRVPYYEDSVHIVQNERTVTRFTGEYRNLPLSFYVVQIGAKTVNGIDSYFRKGEQVTRGEKFGMIRIGSQVDLVLPQHAGLTARVRPGDRVRAGETIVAQ
jgi:phosphatidylserine decarboxylase